MRATGAEAAMLRMLRMLLVVVLAGANAVYFLLVRDSTVPVFDSAPVPGSTTARTVELDPDVPAAPTDQPAHVRRADDVAAVEPPRVASAPTDDGSAGPPLDSPPAPSPTVSAPTASDAPQAAPIPFSGLIVPVQGVSARQLSNTFDDARGQDRVHEALDIMAPRGTPVLAVADGRIEKLFDSDRGGLTIYQFGRSDRCAYYYAHLDRYAPGVVEDKAVRQGEVIGYVGSTGNAAEDAPHLHFAIFVLGPEKHWWEGTAINPYPLLTGKRPL